MRIERKTNSEIRANKEKLVIENFASIMKKLDVTFLIESKEENFDKTVKGDVLENSYNEENVNSLRKQLHTLVGNEMRLEKRVNMYGGDAHKSAHNEAKRELEAFLRDNPLMMDYVEDVEEHFSKRLYEQNEVGLVINGKHVKTYTQNGDKSYNVIFDDGTSETIYVSNDNWNEINSLNKNKIG